MPCQVDELVAAQAKFGPEIRKVFIHQPEWELIVSGRDGRMRGEYIATACFGYGLLEWQALGHKFARAFQYQEGRVTFIHVPDCGFESQSTQGAYAADSQQYFLHYAAVEVRPVQARGEFAIIIAVAFDI